VAAQTALITGASSGIGRALAAEFARHGFDLVLVARSEGRLRAVADDLRQRFGVNSLVLPHDLAQPEAPATIHGEVAAQGIGVDVLVNNAGMQVFGPVQDTDIGAQLRLIQVNLVALAHLTLLFIPDMRSRGGGRILNVASTAAFSPAPFNAAYCASKAFVLYFSEAIACDLEGTGITVTCLCPGPTRTEFAQRAGIENVRIFHLGALSAERVARVGYRALMRGRTTVVPGLLNRVLVFATRLTPRRLATRAGRWVMHWRR
jgi:short-subunit dehydrogenase